MKKSNFAPDYQNYSDKSVSRDSKVNRVSTSIMAISEESSDDQEDNSSI